MDAATGVITTVAGTGDWGFSGDGGAATQASFRLPGGVVVDGAGHLYIADSGNHRIRRVDAATGVITTVAGTGEPGLSGDGEPATQASLFSPSGVYVDGAGTLYIADTNNNRIRRVDAATGLITTVAGTGASAGFVVKPVAGPSQDGSSFGDGGPATQASLAFPSGVYIDEAGHLYIADNGNHRIRRVDAATGIITTVAGGSYGDGRPATQASLRDPRGVDVDGAGTLYIADSGNHRIRRVDAATGVITAVAGTGEQGFSGDGGPATQAGLAFPSGVVVDGAGTLYIADTWNQRIRRVDGATGVITTVAGNGEADDFVVPPVDGGPATQDRLYVPVGVYVDEAGTLYIADAIADLIRRVDAATGIITTAAGTGGMGSSVDGSPAPQANTSFPSGVYIDRAGHLYIADAANHRIRRVNAVTEDITTVAGTGRQGFSGDGGPATPVEKVCDTEKSDCVVVQALSRLAEVANTQEEAGVCR